MSEKGEVSSHAGYEWPLRLPPPLCNNGWVETLMSPAKRSERPRKCYHAFGDWRYDLDQQSRPDCDRQLIDKNGVGLMSTRATKDMLSHGGIAVAAPICSRHWMDAPDSEGLMRQAGATGTMLSHVRKLARGAMTIDSGHPGCDRHCKGDSEGLRGINRGDQLCYHTFCKILPYK
jgi:hypothetical protein